MQNWFESWFDTPYYHILYQNRDFNEAEAFIRALHSRFKFQPHHQILDLACGKGRHSVFLHTLGTNVTGVDLSPNSISEAKKFETKGLEFHVHDMRLPFKPHAFDFVINLFTSFGYFDTDTEHKQTIQSVYENLKTNGMFILDYLNADKVISGLPTAEIITRNGINFHITKNTANGYICKNIEFEHQGQSYQFQEKVRAFESSDFEKLFRNAGFDFQVLGGNYALEPFDSSTSDRLIVFGQKK